MIEQKLTEEDFQALENVKMVATLINLLGSDADIDADDHNLPTVLRSAARTLTTSYDHLYGKLMEMPQE